MPIPDIIFLQVGENEVGDEDPSRIISNFCIALCKVFLNAGVTSVLIGAFLQRYAPRRISVSQYSRRVRVVNLELFRLTSEIPWIYERHIHADGAHLSVQGQIVFSKRFDICL